MIKQHHFNKNFAWYEVTDLSLAERKILHDQHNISDELIYYATDPNESARMEYDYDHNLTLMIFDVVTPDSNLEATEPVGILFTNNALFVFVRPATQFTNQTLLAPNNHQLLPTHTSLTPIDIILNGLYSLNSDYVTAIIGINRRRRELTDELRASKSFKKQTNDLLQLETSLVYYLNSLRSNKFLLQDLQRRSANVFTNLQLEHLEDVLVEVTQAIDMAELAQEVTDSLSHSYVNLVNDNLNQTMKLLTVYSILLTVPTIISGFYGENVALPFMNAKYGWQLTILFTLIGMLIVTYLLWRAGFFKK
ncbi:magnesium transporter CorA family protein [Periweissella beninensis]|uniref:magnesium transporter CorA family protein n=1 Tax=Periweissella beninensis TaxID=504936 RepID=UPI0021A4AADD|nr:magnesium transporter CorA family protein [Periweissella beninensis]MCT4396132.1 magnesium transporter CorA family protein [Periweissella beninensis]